MVVDFGSLTRGREKREKSENGGFITKGVLL